MRNNYNTELNRNHSFGKLRRKNKKEIKKVDINPEYQNLDFDKIEQYNKNYRTLENNNPLHSKYNNIYSTYKNRTKNNSDIYHYYYNNNIQKEENNNNKNINNKYINKKTSPIMRPSKSALFKNKYMYDNNISNNNYQNHNHNKDNNDDYYLCQNCINEQLIEEKLKKKNETAYNKRSIPEIFEDKNKYYAQKIIKDKLDEREKKINEAYHNLEKCQELNMKEKLIKENENAPNPLLQKNNNYLYENFRTKYAQKQKYMKDNYKKFQNSERPEITNYFNKYINDPNYKAKEYGEYKPKIIDIENYKKDLSEQINYKINKKRKEKEEDKMNEDKLYFNEMQKFEKENEEKALKKQKIKEELIKGNLDLINAKKEKKDKLIKEEMKYKEFYEKEKIEYKNDLLNEKYKKDRINREFVTENQKNLNRIRRDKEQKKFEKNNYRYVDYSYEPPKEVTDKCFKCHKIYPKKLLTKNSSVFGYKINK